MYDSTGDASLAHFSLAFYLSGDVKEFSQETLVCYFSAIRGADGKWEKRVRPAERDSAGRNTIPRDHFTQENSLKKMRGIRSRAAHR